MHEIKQMTPYYHLELLIFPFALRGQNGLPLMRSSSHMGDEELCSRGLELVRECHLKQTHPCPASGGKAKVLTLVQLGSESHLCLPIGITKIKF